MRLRAQLLVNGVHIVGSETVSWRELHDGQYVIPINAGLLGLPAGTDLRLEVRIENIATVESLETRLQALERAIDSSHILSREARLR